MRKCFCGCLIAAFSCLLIGVFGITLVDSNPTSEYQTVHMNASWHYGWSGVEEMAQSADLIAIVSISNKYDVSEQNDFPMTNYDAEVQSAIYGCEEGDIVHIPMTGGVINNTLYEIADDPLMEVGETWLVFARESGENQYTILTGSQGRFYVDNNTVSSLYQILLQQESDNNMSALNYIEQETTQNGVDLTGFPVGVNFGVFFEKLEEIVEN